MALVIRAAQGGRICLAGDDEVHRHGVGALVQLLEEGVLGVGARDAPDDRAAEQAEVAAVDAGGFAVALHDELLQVVGQQAQPFAVGDDGLAGAVQDVAVPDADEAEPDGQVALERGALEVFIHGAGAVQQLFEDFRTAGDGDGDAGGGPQRVAAAHPVPEAQDLRGGHAVAFGGFGVGGDANELPQGGLARDAGVDEPVQGGFGVGQGLAGGEGLGDDQEGGGGGIETDEVAGQVGRVDVGHEAHVGAARLGQGVADQARAQVGAADTDADEGGEWLTTVAAQFTLAEAAGQVDDALTFGAGQLGRVGVAFEAAQGGVQHLPSLGGVGNAAAEHVLARFGQAGAVGHADQGVDDGVVDALLAEVGDEAGGFEAKLGRAARVFEQGSQGRLFKASSLALQDAPGSPASPGIGG